MPEHTSGPWVAAPTMHPGEVRGPNGPVAYVSLAVPIEQRHAMVSLLAAAPELLAALELMLQEANDSYPNSVHVRRKARTAIAKAKGETDA